MTLYVLDITLVLISTTLKPSNAILSSSTKESCGSPGCGSSVLPVILNIIELAVTRLNNNMLGHGFFRAEIRLRLKDLCTVAWPTRSMAASRWKR